jgi:tetratricopeptide (TPR) repeat protein
MLCFSTNQIRGFVALLASIGFLGFAKPKVDLSDVGEVWLENSGKAEAQEAFLHGLAQMHNFEYGFAAKDFQQAQELDPDFALAYWGEAMTHNHPIWMRQDKEKALAALAKFASTPEERQARGPTELARDLFAAVDILYGDCTKEACDDLYEAYMAELYQKYPDNVEIAAFYALSIMGTAHEGRAFDIYMRSAAITQRFIHQYPRHPGIAHYLIHATDDPIHAPLGLDAADAYSEIAPNAGHAQHMTTHIYLALGDWDGVIRNNIRASEITNEDRASRDLGPAGCGHYTSWLMYGYLQTGERHKAKAIMDLCHENVRDSESQYGRGYFSWQRSLYLLDTGEWEGDVAAMEANYGDSHGARFEHLIMDGWIAINTGKVREAKAALKGAQAAFAEQKKKWDADAVAADKPFRKEPIVQLLQLEALIALDAGRNEKGLKLLRKAVRTEKELPFGFGPPQPAKPSLELLGETLLAMGQKKEARSVLEETLSRTPNKALSLKALAATNAGSGS